MESSPPTPSKSGHARAERRRRRAGLVFEVGVLETLRGRDADDPLVLAALGEAYTRLGRHRDGLAMDRRLVELRPDDPIAHYNLACSWALVGDSEAAIEELLLSFEHGYRDFEHLDRDTDLRRLRRDPRFVRVREAIQALLGSG